MKELDLQNKYLINFLCKSVDGLKYNEAKANTVSSNFFVIEDLKYFLSETELNKSNYKTLLRKFNSEKELLNSFTDFLDERIRSSMNMAIFINNNQSVTFEGYKLHLFYPSGTETYGDKLFNQNIFSVVQELPYTFKYKDNQLFSFRPDLTFFLNGIYIGYSELKSNYNNQNARKNGRKKVGKDYLSAAQEYLQIAKDNDLNQSIRKSFLKIFEKEIRDYINDHFEECDKKSPLSSPREEIMITEYEGFHSYFYSESMSIEIMDTIRQFYEKYGDMDNIGQWLEIHNEYCSESNMDSYTRKQ